MRFARPLHDRRRQAPLGAALLAALLLAGTVQAQEPTEEELRFGRVDIATGGIAGWFTIGFVNVGAFLDVGVRLAQWRHVGPGRGGIYVDTRVERTLLPTMAVLSGARIQADLGGASPYFVVRGGAWLMLYPEPYESQGSADPILTVGGGISIPDGFPVTFYVEANAYVLPVWFHQPCGPGDHFECSDPVPLQVSLGVRIRTL